MTQGTTNNQWTVKKSAELYGINYWGSNYFRVNDTGNMEIRPHGQQGPGLDLFHLTQDLIERGIRLPILLRFPDVIRSRIELLAGCFQKAVAACLVMVKICSVNIANMSRSV